MPSITIWDRLEPRCRVDDPSLALQARVHDPLWLLARQWQVGEFEGRDAGSPVVATVQSSIAPLDRFCVAGQAPLPWDGSQPIETLVEREPVRSSVAPDDLRQTVEAGLYFLRLLAVAQIPASIAALYQNQYVLNIASSTASDVTALALVINGRVIDAVKLYADLVAAGAHLPALPAIPEAQQQAVFAVTRNWLQWYGSLFAEPSGQTAGWSADRLEYSFSMAAAGDKNSYIAQEYDGGSVDWHTFDRTTVQLAGGTAQPSVKQQIVVATPVTFRGMPTRRFWEMEDASTSIGLLSAAAEDLGRLLLREFVLIYGNDWFQFPLLAPVGSQVLITSLSVADTFGVSTAISHYSNVDGAFGKWHMFSNSIDPLAPPVFSTGGVQPVPLLLTPGAVATLDSAAIEDVLLLRDELANVAWGIERTVIGASGELLDRTIEWRKTLPANPPPSGDRIPYYRLGSTVPDYWLPYMPVKFDAARHLQLQRGRLPNSATGPQGRFLSEEMSMFLEEVPRDGVHLVRRYRWARSADGSSCLWIGRLRAAGRGEGRSGLRFDFLE